MSEYQGSDIPGWLRQAASSLEEVAHSDVPDLHRRSRESGGLRQLVDYAADRLALLRLQNLRESLADVEQVLQGLKQEQEIRRREGRSIRLTEQLIAQADQERTRILRQIASAVEIPGIYSERRRSRESSMEGRSSTEEAITRNFAKFYRSGEERSWTPEPRYYRDEEFDEDPPYYYSRSLERRSREVEQSSREPSATTLRSAASRERPRSTADSASWLSVRVERKSRSSSSPAPLSLGRGPTAPSQETPRAPAPGFSLARTQPIPDSTRRRPTAASNRLEWLGSRVRPAEVTAEDLPAIEPDEELLFSDEDLQDLENLDFGDEELDADVSLEDLDLSDIDLNDLDMDLDLEELDLEDGLEDLSEVDFDEDEWQADLLEPEEAELVDDELADPFLDDLDDELEEDLGLELEAEPEVDLDALEYLDDDEELEADPTQLDVDLEGLDLEADELDDIDFSDLDLEEGDGEAIDIDLGDFDLDDLDDIDLDLAELEDETEIVTLTSEALEEEPIVLEAPPVEVEEALGPPGLELVELEPTEATGFFEGGPLEAAPSFLEGDELFASGELPALEVSAEASVEGDLLTGSVEALEPSGDFFSESFEGDNSWLDAPVADSVDAPEWLKSPDEGFPAIGEAPPLDSPDKVSALEEAPSALEEAIEAASVPGEVASPPPAAVEAPPKPTGASAQERRKLVRLSCSYDLTAYVEGRPVPCKLMDISLGGGKLVGPDGFQRGQLIQVSNPLPEAKTSDPVTARIVWMRPNRELAGKFDLGLQFEESPVALGKSWVITVINKISMSSKMFNQRKYTRAVANMPIEVVLITAERLPGTAIDLGLGGALLAVDRPMTPTTKITLHIGPLGNHDKLELRCEIISSRHDENGRGWTHSVKFNEISTTQTKLLGKYVVDLLKTGGSV